MGRGKDEKNKGGPLTELQVSTWSPVQNLALDLNSSLCLKSLTALKQ